MATATTFRPETKRIVVAPGGIGLHTMPYSEACMHMRIAGKVMAFRLTDSEHPMVQLHNPEDGSEFSSPVTTGEAGLYYDQSEGEWWYPKRNLVVECPEYYRGVRDFALRVGLENSLRERLHYLASYSDRPTVCHLYKDWAPYSFEFVMLVLGDDMKLERWFNGGLIYSGPDCPADGSSPSLTVSLTPRVGWSTHT